MDFKLNTYIIFYINLKPLNKIIFLGDIYFKICSFEEIFEKHYE